MKNIKGYEGIYKISKAGEVWSIKNSKKGRWKEARRLKYWLIGNGYQMVMLYKKSIPKKFLVHRLVALTYLVNPNQLPEVNHINGDRFDNRVENLEWISIMDNHRHAFKIGLYNKNIGTKHYLAKLNPKKVKQIRGLLELGYRYYEIAPLFDVHNSAIRAIDKGFSWKHVE